MVAFVDVPLIHSHLGRSSILKNNSLRIRRICKQTSHTPSGPAVLADCTNRPDRRLHPTKREIIILCLQRRSHPQTDSQHPPTLPPLGFVGTARVSRSRDSLCRFSVPLSLRPRVRPSYFYQRNSICIFSVCKSCAITRLSLEERSRPLLRRKPLVSFRLVENIVPEQSLYAFEMKVGAFRISQLHL
jgi:hypothetical protein